MSPFCEPEFNPPFEWIEPSNAKAPVLVNSPHSGNTYPQSLLSKTELDSLSLRKSEDAFVDKLFTDAPLHGASMLNVFVPRAYLDLNREPYELDPKLIRERLPSYANPRTQRVAAGLGTIPRIVSDGLSILNTPLSLMEALERIERIHKPYHATLSAKLRQMRDTFGLALLIDAHSMPSIVSDKKMSADIILGDRYGASCAPWIMDISHDYFSKMGLRVARNNPFAGGYITEHHGRPERGIHALQIEIRRDLYMDERTIEPKPTFNLYREIMSNYIQTVSQHVQEKLSTPAFLPKIAAE